MIISRKKRVKVFHFFFLKEKFVNGNYEYIVIKNEKMIVAKNLYN